MTYKRVDVPERTGIDKTEASKECMFCHCWYFKDDFKIESNVCDNSYNVLITAYELEDIAILNKSSLDYRCILWGITKNEAVIRSNKSVLENKGVYKWTLVQIRDLLK